MLTFTMTMYHHKQLYSSEIILYNIYCTQHYVTKCFLVEPYIELNIPLHKGQEKQILYIGLSILTAQKLTF